MSRGAFLRRPPRQWGQNEISSDNCESSVFTIRPCCARNSILFRTRDADAIDVALRDKEDVQQGSFPAPEERGFVIYLVKSLLPPTLRFVVPFPPRLSLSLLLEPPRFRRARHNNVQLRGAHTITYSTFRREQHHVRKPLLFRAASCPV